MITPKPEAAMTDNLATAYIADIQREFNNQRRLAERAMAQLTDDDFFAALDGEANSVAVIVKHVGGNLRSRWRDFLTADGEKPDRDRDSEFLADSDTRESITALWQTGFNTLEQTLSSLTPDDLSKQVRIRAEPLPVIQAIHRSLAHTAHHIGQIVLLAKHLRGAEWQTLSIARGKSAEFVPSTPSK
jgi:hypothetical protein